MTHTLPADLVSYLLIGTSAFLLIHWLRRAILKPAGPSTADPNARDSAGFDRFQILFHWGTLVALLVTIASGLALYYPFVLEPAAMAVGFPIHRNFRLLIDVHVASVVAFALLIAAHIAWDVFKVKGSHLVIPGPNDIRQLAVRVESFVRGGEIPRGGKYDVFMKSFHILLTITSIILAVTGATLYFFAPWWLVPQLSHPAIEPWWKPTILHDLFGFSLVVLLTAHTYFALLRVNRPLLRAMFRPRSGAPVNRVMHQRTSARSLVVRTVSPGPSASGMSHFANRFAGVTSVGLLTYIGEYASYLVVLAYLSDRLVVSYRLGLYGFGIVGPISGAYLVLSGLIAVPIGHLCDKYGRRRFTIIGCLLGAIALLSLTVLDRLTDLVGFSLGMAAVLSVLGIAHGTYTASTLAYTGDLAEHEGMGKPYGLIEGAEFAGYAFGPALGTTIAFALGSRSGVFEISASMLLAAAVIAFFLMPERRGSPPNGPGSKRENEGADRFRIEIQPNPTEEVHVHSVTWKDFFAAFRIPIIGVALLTTFVGSVGFSGFFYYVPLYANFLRNSFPIFGLLYGYFASIMAVTAVILMVPLGHIEDSGKRRMPYLVAGLLLGALSLAFVFFTPTVPTFLIASIAFGVSIAIVRVSQLVILAENSKSSNRAAIMGTNHAVEHAGYGVASLVVGVMVASFGFVGAFRGLSLVLLTAGIGFFLYALKKKVR